MVVRHVSNALAKIECRPQFSWDCPKSGDSGSILRNNCSTRRTLSTTMTVLPSSPADLRLQCLDLLFMDALLQHGPPYLQLRLSSGPQDRRVDIPLNSTDIKSARGAGQIVRLPVHKEEEKHSGNYRLIKRMRITATSARVAESDGAKRLPGLPVIKTCLTAQPMASNAQALTEAPSA